MADGQPLCVASTSPCDHYFKDAEWSPDGTTLLTNSADHRIRTYLLPHDLLEASSPHRLEPYSTLACGETTYATAIYPRYDLADPSTTVFLTSIRDHPIRLTSVFDSEPIVASYSMVKPTTEAFIAPHSLLFPQTLGGTHFLAGSDSLICVFDVEHTGAAGPKSWLPTVSGRDTASMKGIVSAMASNPSGNGTLAAGTFTRRIGLYGSNGTGDCQGTWHIGNTEADREIGGRGVTQLLWSPCGRYLYAAERQSDGVIVYDIRRTASELGYLCGRKAVTNQRMRIDVVSSGSDGSHEIWAGGTDGFMRVWRDPAFSVGKKDPDAEFRVHDDAVSSTVFHSMGNSDDSDDSDDSDASDDSDDSDRSNNCLKVWSMPFLEGAEVADDTY
ncbi:hypothetical protein N7532_004950 [Penicillium argentinense]|uniref:Uncharacterized protein n=1 Tax=Penicillium argentinense TaxID=1131581 RepID=A0A9W9K9C7_9EURO|nr:uncharacterized protein N7532_004950 [Penicillium argentinense]KAJ5097949.1 hypothetical protein N7532_004950 [Penicillium argentinense]